MEAQRDAAARDWSELPLDALSSIFIKLGAVEILMGAGLVCHSWLHAAKVLPDLWRSVIMVRDAVVADKDESALCAMAKVAVDRSDGQLKVFLAKQFVTDELLNYIGDRSPSLKSLGLISCPDVTNQGFTHLTTRSPLLEDLVLVNCPNVGGDAYEATGVACEATLKRLVLRKGWYDQRGGALGIATMRELRDLSLVGSDITTDELAAVVDACPHLERLRVNDCYNVVVDDALRAKCAGIKDLTLPSVQDAQARYYLDDYDEPLSSRDVDGWGSD
ncbi:putative F-box/LRR-repeat protein 23 [Triticum dicoccoides]|uniref:putative F-box/LRR-repeat protein 23 n=1 Tax=Triticum dicoccoides TaxID=85692 RepID=UPI00188EAB9D|nr:putative F-box/LRR-repeat protein 23 [Triticum dicoccoides]